MNYMKNSNPRLGWIFVNSQSNEYKVERFKQEASSTKHKISVISASDLCLRNISKGQIELVDVQSGLVVEIPNFIISLIPDEKYDPISYKILEYLESKSVHFLNSIKSVRLATDKFQSNVLLSNKGFSVPKTYLFSKLSKLEFEEFPYIVKPLDGRKGRGVKVINSSKELANYLEFTEELSLIMQEFVSDSFGKDIRTYVLNGKCIGAVRREKKKTALSNYNSNPIDLDIELTQKAVAIAKLFGLTFCCVDFFIDDKNTVCEVNANPGYKNFEKHISINLPELIYRHFN